MSRIGPDCTSPTLHDSSIGPGPYRRASRVAAVGGSRTGRPSSAKARRRWTCPDCGQEFSKKDSRHIDSHLPPELQTRDYCPYGCGKSVPKGQFTNLYPHIRLKHTHERLRCVPCGIITHDNFRLSRHWADYHEGEDKPPGLLAAPKLPPKIQVSSPPATAMPIVGSSSSAFSVLQLWPLPPVSSNYGSPPPPSAAASSSSSVYSTPYSPAHPLSLEDNPFSPQVADDSVLRVSEIASMNSPVTVMPSEHLPPDAPALSPLDSDIPLPDFDVPAPHGNYRHNDDESHFRDVDLIMPTFPSPQLMDDHASLIMSGFGHLPSNEFSDNDILNDYNGGTLGNFIKQVSNGSGLDCSLIGDELILANSLPDVPSPQSSLTSATGSTSTDQWSLPSNILTLPVVDSFAESAMLSSSPSTYLHPSDYGYGPNLDHHHLAEVDGISSPHVAPASLPDIGGSQYAPHHSKPTSGFEVLNDTDGSEMAYWAN
ncbi:hypothetical protein DL96DRAFT_1656560 [Flagelloscypha sp. PMI_526]|nr:hypothetical protein DL96DRAFT_1656560 [Flagelloscypha sp. PMI_526]